MPVVYMHSNLTQLNHKWQEFVDSKPATGVFRINDTNRFNVTAQCRWCSINTTHSMMWSHAVMVYSMCWSNTSFIYVQTTSVLIDHIISTYVVMHNSVIFFIYVYIKSNYLKYTGWTKKSGEQPSFDTATETISDLLNVGRQCSKRSAAMLRFLVLRGA